MNKHYLVEITYEFLAFSLKIERLKQIPMGQNAAKWCV